MSEHKYIPVQDVMTRKVHTIAALETVDTAIDMLREHRVSSLVVERRDDHDEFGLVVVSDIAQQVIVANRSPSRVNIYEIMSKPVINLPAEMDIRYAREMICDWRGAGQAQGSSDPLTWYAKNKDKMQLHPATRSFVEKEIGFVEGA